MLLKRKHKLFRLLLLEKELYIYIHSTQLSKPYIQNEKPSKYKYGKGISRRRESINKPLR